MSGNTDRVYEVLIAVGEDSFTNYIERVLRRQTTVDLNVVRTSEVYSLIDQTKEMIPDLLIVSPLILSDPMVPMFREATGLEQLKIVAYCTTLLEDKYSKNFDAKMLITDQESDLTQVLESVLEIEVETEEQVLTPREQEVVIAVVKGLTNKEIAEELYLSTHTIITHRRNIARKLNIHSPSGLTIYAIMNNLVKLDDIKDL